MDYGTQMTLDQWKTEIFHELTSGASEHHVKALVSQEKEKDSMGSRVSFEKYFESLGISKKKIDLNGLSMKTLRECLVAQKDLTTLPFSLKWTRGGYDVEWDTLNTADYLPQNRERIYTVGHLRSRGSRKVFPLKRTDGENNIRQIGKISSEKRDNPNQYRVYDPNGLSPCLNKMEGGEPMFTLTTQDRQGIAVEIPIKEAVQCGYSMAKIGDSINLDRLGSTTRRGRIGHGVANTLDTSCNQGIMVQYADNCTAYAIWYKKYQCYIAIRRLTPKECFRLQGFTDKQFEKAQFINSDSQLYKQAGNAVSVPVVADVARKLY